MELSDLEKVLLADCVDDDMGLWAVVWHVYGGGYGSDTLPIWVCEQTIDVLAKLLSKKLIIIGTLQIDNNYEFSPCTESSDEILKRINDEWIESGKPPNIGGEFWIKPSKLGEQLAKELGL